MLVSILIILDGSVKINHVLIVFRRIMKKKKMKDYVHYHFLEEIVFLNQIVALRENVSSYHVVE
jgi:Na+-transporting NADH:ubiquinone oxidoreductase subunit NqrE